MTNDLQVKINFATGSDIAEHLQECSRGFVPPLEERIEIFDYTNKIMQNAERIETWAGDKLVGLIAAYCNDQSCHRSFITNFSVLPSWQRHGIGRSLLQHASGHILRLGFDCLELKVHVDNKQAIAFYCNGGFVVKGQLNQWLFMEKHLEEIQNERNA